MAGQTRSPDDGDDEMITSSKAQMWVEKYRPKDIKDVAAQQEVTNALLGAIEQGQLPHLLFYGPPGTGKTSTILAATRMLYHPKIWCFTAYKSEEISQ
jgi:replication factor C subunit 2/4